MGAGMPGMGYNSTVMSPGVGMDMGAMGMGNEESRMFKLQAERTGMMVTVIPQMGAIPGEHGILTPKPNEPINIHQQFRWEQARAFPGFYLMVCASNPNHVVRFT